MRVYIGLLLASVLACSGGGDAAGASAYEGSRVIGTAGGTLDTPSGASVEIASGAVSEDVPIALAAVDAHELAVETPPGIRFTGRLVAFTPHGTQFASPVKVQLPFVGTTNTVLRLADENDTSWEILQGATFEASLATVYVTQFSIMVPVEGEERTLAHFDVVPPVAGSGGTGGGTGGTAGTNGGSGGVGGSGGAGGTGGSGGAAGTSAGTSGGTGSAGTSGGDACPPNLAIPALCRLCADGSCGEPSCSGGEFVGFVCPEDGTAGTGGSGVDAGTGYEPCAGKSCGDFCTLCDPTDTDCVETAVVKTCDASGACVATAVECP